MEMSLAINGSDPLRQKGEAWAEVFDHDVTGKPSPIDLHAATITAWVYVPRNIDGQDAYGPKQNPNGMQLFAKDSTFRSLYGQWTHLKLDEWFLLELPVTSSNAGYVDHGFDPTKIAAVGVKFAVGCNSTAAYKGQVYVDDLTW